MSFLSLQTHVKKLILTVHSPETAHIEKKLDQSSNVVPLRARFWLRILFRVPLWIAVLTVAHTRGNQRSVTILVRASIAVKRQYDHSNSYKGEHLTGASLQFSGLDHCHRGGTQADMVLERQLRVLSTSGLADSKRRK